MVKNSEVVVKTCSAVAPIYKHEWITFLIHNNVGKLQYIRLALIQKILMESKEYFRSVYIM